MTASKPPSSALERKGSGIRLIVPVIGGIGLVWCGWLEFTRPHVYRHAVTPDGARTVTVLSQRVPPYVEGIDLILQVEDGSGNMLHNERFAKGLDIWLDVETKYSEFSVDNERIQVGPYSWDRKFARRGPL
jgi:hypothetical protein